jgi:Flp pilus assembly pilin Flp
MFDRFNLWVGSLIARTQDLKDEGGQTFVEYALVLVLVAVAVVTLGAFTGLAGDIGDAITKVKNAVDPAPAA